MALVGTRPVCIVDGCSKVSGVLYYFYMIYEIPILFFKLNKWVKKQIPVFPTLIFFFLNHILQKYMQKGSIQFIRLEIEFEHKRIYAWISDSIIDYFWWVVRRTKEMKSQCIDSAWMHMWTFFCFFWVINHVIWYVHLLGCVRFDQFLQSKLILPTFCWVVYLSTS